METLPPELAERVALVASDRESGASEVLDAALEVLRMAVASGYPLLPVARALCRAQPSMASVWSAALAALTEGGAGIDAFAARVGRAPRGLARFAVEALAADDDAGVPLRLVSLSFSRSVAHALEAVQTVRPIRLACSEGRPALEGRRLASRASALGIAVTCYSDAAIGHALAAADAVLVGADAITPEWFLNKSGTRMLAAAALQQGVPVHVVATRDKFVPHAIAARLTGRDGRPAEIWESPPAGVTVRNPYFEPTPLDLITSVISDTGVLGAGMIPDVCESTQNAAALALLDEL